MNWWTDDRVNGEFVSHVNDSSSSWKNGRQLLRQYVVLCCYDKHV